MHAIPANSPQSMVARLKAKFRHNRQQFNKAMPRQIRQQRRNAEREYVNNVSRCLYPCWHDFVEL